MSVKINFQERFKKDKNILDEFKELINDAKFKSRARHQTGKLILFDLVNCCRYCYNYLQARFGRP